MHNIDSKSNSRDYFSAGTAIPIWINNPDDYVMLQPSQTKHLSRNILGNQRTFWERQQNQGIGNIIKSKQFLPNMKQILAHVCGIPVSSSSVAYPNRLFLVPASGQYHIPPSSNGPLKLKQYKIDGMNKLGGKADNLANGIREHRNTKFGHPSKEEEKRKILHKPEISDPGSHYGVRDCLHFQKNQFVHSNCILMMYLTCHGPSLRKPDEFGTPFSNVTCIQFNPVDDRYFISGSLDAKVHIWSIPDHQVIDWNDLHEMVTAACYTPDGQGALVGSYKGSCRLYNTSVCTRKLIRSAHYICRFTDIGH